MVNFSLSDEQQALCEVVRRFSLNEIRPAAAKFDSAADPEAAVRRRFRDPPAGVRGQRGRCRQRRHRACPRRLRCCAGVRAGTQHLGRPIIQFESVASKLTEMRMKIEAARALVWKVAWSVDNPDESNHFARLGTMATIFPAGMVRDVTAGAMDIFAGAGYMRDLPTEKYVRDAMIFPIYDGTNDLLKQFMAKELPAVPSSIC